LHILVNDFIGGVLDRGIPLYVRNLVDGLREEEFRVTVIRAPGYCRKMPRGVFYAIAVLFEQIVMPLIGLLLRADLTLYPYNSIAIIDVVTGRGRIVIHDLEQLNRGLSPSKLYYLACYRVLRWLNSHIFTISALTHQRLIESGLLGAGPITTLPNTFHAFERLVGLVANKRDPKTSILLCTGFTANKDLPTVIADYLPKLLAAGFRVSILGLHRAPDTAKLGSFVSFLNSGQLRLCGQLTDREVAAEYRKHEIAWVHSLREGFGRCVVEGRLAGCRVICTDIPEFTKLCDDDVCLYTNSNDFGSALDRLVQTDTPIRSYDSYPYRELLREAIQEAQLSARAAPAESWAIPR
jgi:glycosyltransferase involved in cell wall biosynthesis